MSTTAVMHKGMTFFRDTGRGRTEVWSADTVAEAGRMMAEVFRSGIHEVKFHIVESAPVPVEQQITNRIRKLKRIAAIAGRSVTRFDRNGATVTVLVAK